MGNHLVQMQWPKHQDPVVEELIHRNLVLEAEKHGLEPDSHYADYIKDPNVSTFAADIG